MPGDTKIKRNAHLKGWFDVDEPTVLHKTRWQARAARKAKKAGLQVAYTKAPQPKVTSGYIQAAKGTSTTHATITVSGIHDFIQSVTKPKLTSLQSKLLNRLHNSQNVNYNDAEFIVTHFGYNAAASYGHMRVAGATHDEAYLVVSLNNPHVSVTYGLLRAQGEDHISALREAIK